MSDHIELENSVAAMVLGVAEEEERDTTRAHLGGCAECRQLAARLQRAADALPLAVDLIEPPARLRSRILATAAASDRTPARARVEPRILRLPRMRTRGWAWRPRLAARVPTAAFAGLALAVVGLGAWNVQLSDQLSHHQAAGQVASLTMAGRGEMAGARANLVDFRAQSVALVTFSRMPTPPPGKVYQVWLIPASGAPEGVAVFQPDADGSKTVVLIRDLHRYKVMAVTVEDGPDGVAAPTQTPSLGGNLA